MAIKSCCWSSWMRKKSYCLTFPSAAGFRELKLSGIGTKTLAMELHVGRAIGAPWGSPAHPCLRSWHSRTCLDLQSLPELPSCSAQAGCCSLGMLLSNLVLPLRLSLPCAAFLLPLPLPSASGWRGILEAQEVKIWWKQISWGKNILLETAMG